MLVLGTSVFSAFEIRQAPYFNVIDFWKHALATALIAELLAKKLKISRPEDAFTCGLLHDIGKIALFRVSPDLMKSVCDKAKLEGLSFLDAEMQLGLPGHTLLGERLAERWQLPVIIRKAVRYHHRNIIPMDSIYANMKPTLMVVSLANDIAKRLAGVEAKTSDYEAPYRDALGISSEVLAQIEAEIPREMERADGFLSASLSS
jgi:putative nucleotidyltransferase with HDIG domain